MKSSTSTRWVAAALLGFSLSITAGVGVGASAHAAPAQKCGALKKGGYVYAKKVTAKNISCRKAKQKIHGYFLPGNDLDGYRCTGYPRSTCTKGRVVIAFTYP